MQEVLAKIKKKMTKTNNKKNIAEINEANSVVLFMQIPSTVFLNQSLFK